LQQRFEQILRDPDPNCHADRSPDPGAYSKTYAGANSSAHASTNTGTNPSAHARANPGAHLKRHQYFDQH